MNRASLPLYSSILDGIGVARLAFRSFREAFTATSGARFCIQRIWVQQMKFTGVDACHIVVMAGFLIGAIVALQSLSILPQVGAAGMLGKLMAMVVIRELGPILVAFIVIGRSGTAMSVEIGTMVVGGEVAALRSLGISPRAYIVFPRIVGVVLASFILLVYFDMASLFGGYVASSMLIKQHPDFYLRSLGEHIHLIDIVATILKGFLFGLIISSIACYFGLRVQRSITEVPQAAMRTVVAAILACLACDLLVSFSYIRI